MLPDLLPDMTLYSLCACAHRMSNRTSASQTSAALFGSPQAGLLQDFPYALEEFCSRTHSAYGHPLDVARNTTTISYFTRFRPTATVTELHQMLVENAVSRFKLSLGLHSSPIGAKFALRACSQCNEEDIRDHGTAYWHRRHQLPGVWACPRHGRPLRYSTYRVDRRKKSSYVLPCDPDILASAPLQEVSHSGMEALRRFAVLSATILDTDLPAPYSAERLRHAYLHGLKAQGLLTRHGHVRVQALTQRLQTHYVDISKFPPFDWILSPSRIEGFARLVRQPRSDIHTTYHVLMIDALFGSWTSFARVYEWEAAILPVQEPRHESTTGMSTTVCLDARATAVLAQVKSNARSLSAVCKENRIDYQTVLRQFAAAGEVVVVRRPKLLTAELRASVVEALMQGLPQRQVAASLGLSRTTVDRVCVETPSLHADWQRARFLRVRDIERKKMQAFLIDNPGVGRARARAVGDNGYSWLNRHDADWLRSAITAKVPVRGQAQRRRERVQWQARDSECLLALEKLASGVSFAQGDRRTTGALMRKLPRLSFAPRLERLPKAKAYAEQLVANELRIAPYPND